MPNLFDDVNFRIRTLSETIKRNRRAIAENLESLIEDSEISHEMIVKELIAFLRRN